MEQWRREREAAKKAEEEAKSQAVSTASQSISTADDQTAQQNNKGWTLDDDDEDEAMEVDGAPGIYVSTFFF